MRSSPGVEIQNFRNIILSSNLKTTRIYFSRSYIKVINVKSEERRQFKSTGFFLVKNHPSFDFYKINKSRKAENTSGACVRASSKPRAVGDNKKDKSD